MNIFFLHESPSLCAQYHCDKHVVKMIVEYAQLLSTAHRILDNVQGNHIYKKTHTNHPCAIWVMETSSNYFDVYYLLEWLCKEYKIRFNKIHKTTTLLKHLWYWPKNIAWTGNTKIPLCMPEKYKVNNQPYESYRNYYNFEKKHIHKWTNREIPNWISKD